MATSYERVTKQHDAAVNTEKTQTARMKNDPKSFFLCPYNVGAHPRRLRRASDAGGVGCSAWFGGPDACRNAERPPFPTRAQKIPETRR
jgi:hypothetical protein